MKHIKKTQGFTLIELLIVIGILAVLLAITIIAINPAKQFAKANNSARLAAINSILNAVGQCYADNKGTFAPGSACDPIGQVGFTAGSVFNIEAAVTQGNTGATSIAGTNVNLCGLVAGGYIAALPKDPSTGTPTASSIDLNLCGGTALAALTVPTTAYNTGYTIVKSPQGKITISAPGTDTTADPNAVTSVTR